jgi:hypothetical protein
MQILIESADAGEDSENLVATATLAGEPASPVRNSQTLVFPCIKSHCRADF